MEEVPQWNNWSWDNNSSATPSSDDGTSVRDLKAVKERMEDQWLVSRQRGIPPQKPGTANLKRRDAQASDTENSPNESDLDYDPPQGRRTHRERRYRPEHPKKCQLPLYDAPPWGYGGGDTPLGPCCANPCSEPATGSRAENNEIRLIQCLVSHIRNPIDPQWAVRSNVKFPTFLINFFFFP